MSTDKVIPNFDPSVYYKNAVIREPSSANQPKRIIRLVVDSRERNMTLFPNPNAYEINILEDVQNVESLSLVAADFPFDPYTVRANANMLYIAYNNTVYNVAIDIGNYTETELANAMQVAINAAVGSNDFIVAYNALKDNWTFRCLHAFGLVFRGKTFTTSYNNSPDTAYAISSIGKTIGFGINNYLSIVQTTNDAFVNVITSEFKKNFIQQDYIVLNIENFELNKSTAGSIHNSFMIITQAGETSPYGTEYANMVFKPKLNKLYKLKVNIVDFYGNPYDFQNKDHRFELLMLCDF